MLAPAQPGQRRRVLALGEAKWGTIMDHRHVERLERAARLLADRGYDTSATVLECFSGAGFADGIDDRAGHRVTTTSLADLYQP